MHEYPKRDTPYTEDMGRRGGRFAITGYVIGSNYDIERDDLFDALEQEGAGLLVHPTMGEFMVVPDGVQCQESRQRARVAEFEMGFLEAGQAPSTASTDTVGPVKTSAEETKASAASTADAKLAKGDSVAL